MPTKVTKIYQRVLRREDNAIAFATKVGQRVLVVTEPAAELKAASITGVRESALIQEFAGYSGAGHVHSSALVQVEAPLPWDAPFINHVHASVLIEDPTKSYVTGVDSSALLLVEGPIVRTESNKTFHSALTQDLYRGQVFANQTAHLALGQTEVPTRNPERWKVASILHASVKPYADPQAVIAAHRYQAFTMMSGVSTLYPARSVSPARSPSVVAQTVVKINGKDLASYRSATLLPSVYAAAAARVVKSNPTDIKSKSQGFQIAVESASSKTLSNPVNIVASYRFRQISLGVGITTQYQELTGIHSYVRNQTTSLFAATSKEYPSPPTSQMIVNSFKAEAAAKTTFLAPTDPKLASTIAVQQIEKQLAFATYWNSPQSVISSETTQQITIQTGAATLMGDPIGITPGGRGYQTQLQIMMGSPDYQTLPISYIATRHLEAETALSHTMRDPQTIKEGVFGHQVELKVATAVRYTDPTAAKPKRRLASAQVGRKPA